MLTRKRPAATQPIDSAPRLVSSKHLDLVLLACCSCLLTVMCHSTANLLPQSATSAAIGSSPAASAGQTNFYVRSALLSAYQSKGKSESKDS
ncbi:MAG: hypothetical protein HC895_13530 [Leptolyngbyaceae cyanobacterium SM1_3_5]|nr:hypothetical protein [Leptolyngbyaceae cyanobacterium SM1_3_5]